MAFEYQTSTKDAYKTAEVANRYHSDFTGPLSWRRIRFRFIADRERRAIGSMLDLVQATTVVDIPCGTGKLASQLAERGYKVVAVDVSAEMLTIARTSYASAGIDDAEFIVSDAESVGSALVGRKVDLIICLRLMHRVPRQTRLEILREFARTARYLVVSFGIDSTYQKLRRKVRNSLFGGGLGLDLCLDSLQHIQSDVETCFSLLKQVWISPLLSEEVVLLLKSNLK